MTISAALTFDAAEHVYRFGSDVVPSVTQVMAAAGLCDYSFSNEFAMLRGSRVHEAIALELTRGLDWSTVAETEQPFVSAGLQMIEDLRADVVEVEHRMYSQQYGFAGTLDLIVRIDGKLVLIDFKTGQPMLWTGVQLAAYGHLYYEETKQLVTARYAAHLKHTGDYTLKPFTNRTDRDRFLAALTVVNCQREYGTYKETA